MRLPALLLDQGLPRDTAVELRATGFMCTHVGEIGMHAASDTKILELAVRLDAVVITLDADSTRSSSHERRQTLGDSYPYSRPKRTFRSRTVDQIVDPVRVGVVGWLSSDCEAVQDDLSDVKPFVGAGRRGVRWAGYRRARFQKQHGRRVSPDTRRPLSDWLVG
jgi:Domain of unknown function (DUF5615)